MNRPAFRWYSMVSILCLGVAELTSGPAGRAISSSEPGGAVGDALEAADALPETTIPAFEQETDGRAMAAAVRAAGRGNPWINLSDGQELSTVYFGPPALRGVLDRGEAQPLTLAEGDFDEDGVPDLVSGYSFAGGGLLAVRLGNPDAIYPNTREAQNRKAADTFTGAPFLPEARLFAAPDPAEFIGVGDFDADGHLDVVAAEPGRTSLHLLAGDGRGRLRASTEIKLPGDVTALAVGEMNRADGLADVVVGIRDAAGPALLVFEWPEGALRGEPEKLDLDAEATALILGHLDEDFSMDAAAAVGDKVTVVHGRDRRLSLDSIRRSEVQPAKVDSILVAPGITLLAAGDFISDPATDLAVLGSDGTLRILLRDPKDGGWSEGEAVPLPGGPMSRGTRLVRARVSSLPHDDVIVVDDVDRRVLILGEDDPGSGLHEGGLVTWAALDVLDEPAAVLPMRLNADALSDLVVLTGTGAAVTLTGPLSIFVVNSNNDANDGFCNAAHCSLREAIIAANNLIGIDTINFAIGTGAKTITPASLLPTITGPVTIDGTTQPGFAGSPLIELNGTSYPGNADALIITFGSSTVRGFVINRFSSSAAVTLRTNGTNIIEGNFFGTNLAGTAAQPNEWGIVIETNDNTIGGTTTASRNVISGNTHIGVFLPSSGLIQTGNVVRGNFIGTDVSGSVAIGNGLGILVNTDGNITIGGTTAGSGNVISGNAGNGGWGVRFSAGTSSLVQGNFVGTNAAGTAGLGNAAEGIFLNGSACTIGGTVVGARNIVSGNAGIGVRLNLGGTNQVQGNYIGTNAAGTGVIGNLDSGVSLDGGGAAVGGATPSARNLISGNGFDGVNVGGRGNLIQGNLIGTDVTGTLPLGNSVNGIRLAGGGGGGGHTVGGTDPGARNTISGNLGDGLEITSNGNQVQGNLIGTKTDGVSPLGNGAHGIELVFAADRNTIGGSPGGTNRISFNGGSGVFCRGHQDTILSNSIVANNALGIDLSASGETGVTANDPLDVDGGGNGLQNYPVLTSAVAGGSSISVEGSLSSSANATFTLEFFSNSVCDPSSGYGEGQTFLGSALVTTNGVGTAGFTVSLSQTVSPGSFITSTATASDNSTSEFSKCIPVTGGPLLTAQPSLVIDTCPTGGPGSGDGNLDPGESVVVGLTASNQGTSGATNVSGTITALTSGVTVTDGTAAFPDIPAGGTGASIAPHFAFTVGTGVSCGTMLVFDTTLIANEGAWSEIFAGPTGQGGDPGTTVNYASADVPKPIPDLGMATSLITVPPTGVMTDVNVTVTLTHTFDGDLILALIAPGGATVNLALGLGGSGDNYTETLFDDAAATAITAGSPPFHGTFRPQFALSVLNGIPGTGTWTLRVTDGAAADFGTLLAWSLTLTTSSPATCIPCSVPAPGDPLPLVWSPGSATSLEWPAAPDAIWYDLYRGVRADLPNLLNATPDSCHRTFGTDLTTGNVLTETPPPGTLYWYLVRAGNAAGAGAAGDATAGPRTQDSSGACP